jgi:hypothetical protein
VSEIADSCRKINTKWVGHLFSNEEKRVRVENVNCIQNTCLLVMRPAEYTTLSQNVGVLTESAWASENANDYEP